MELAHFVKCYAAVAGGDSKISGLKLVGRQIVRNHCWHYSALSYVYVLAARATARQNSDL
jgi:hypothetical protein